jgi:hypothetical protein
LRVPKLAKTSIEFILPKTPKDRPPLKISSKSMNNYSTIHVISDQISSNSAACQTKFHIITLKFNSRRHIFLENALNGDFQPKHPVQ